MAIKSGTPEPRWNSERTVCPGALGATIITSKSARGTTWL